MIINEIYFTACMNIIHQGIENEYLIYIYSLGGVISHLVYGNSMKVDI